MEKMFWGYNFAVRFVVYFIVNVIIYTNLDCLNKYRLRLDVEALTPETQKPACIIDYKYNFHLKGIVFIYLFF